ncbi:MAG: stage II sporulation protein P [Tissierella sp.]|uniref:stage II sporulation protein P n=1 Tax=Tissierella sp. TaxID=41274 RepID=UPI003F9CA017
MRRRRSRKNKPRFKSSKRSFKNNKSAYIIIALICLIGLNVGSMIIMLAKNVKASNESNIVDFSKENKFGKVKMVFEEIFNKKSVKDIDRPKDKRDIENTHEEVEDFIIIDDLEEYENFIVVRDSSGKFNLEDIPEPVNVKKIKVDPDKPYVLAFHTHATEGYEPLKKGEYYITDNTQNVIQIGDIFSKTLESGNHKINHDTTHHDRPSFNKSYSRSLNTIKKEMAKEENLKFIFDIHRDGVEIKGKNEKEYAAMYKKHHKRYTTTIDGKEVAKFALVVAAGSENYNENLNYAKYIKAVSDTIYPGLCRGIIIKEYGRFNQYLSDYSALVEVGANVNTIDESK